MTTKKTRLFLDSLTDESINKVAGGKNAANLNNSDDSEFCRILGDLSHDHHSSSSSSASKSISFSTDEENIYNNKKVVILIYYLLQIKLIIKSNKFL